MDADPNRQLTTKALTPISLAFSLSVLGVYFGVMIVFWDRVGALDWDQFATFHLIQEWNYHLFGIVKHWNPLLGGGMSLGGDPQVPVASLSMLLGYLAGSVAGIKLAFLIWVCIGFFGAWLFSGLFSRNPAFRLLAAGLFIGNGFFITHTSHGHVDHFPVFGVPFFLWMIHRIGRAAGARPHFGDRLVRATGLGLLLAPLAVISFDGAPVFPVYYFLWILAYALLYCIREKTVWPLWTLLAAFGAATLVDAVYLVPPGGIPVRLSPRPPGQVP